jgi:hypothetical protein
MNAPWFTSPTIDARRAQAFPVLSTEEVDRMVRFGTVGEYADGARLYETGKSRVLRARRRTRGRRTSQTVKGRWKSSLG